MLFCDIFSNNKLIENFATLLYKLAPLIILTILCYWTWYRYFVTTTNAHRQIYGLQFHSRRYMRVISQWWLSFQNETNFQVGYFFSKCSCLLLDWVEQSFGNCTMKQKIQTFFPGINMATIARKLYRQNDKTYSQKQMIIKI